MARLQQCLCKNHEGNCPNYVNSTVVTIGGTEKFVCPLGLANCERDYLEPIAPPDPPWKKLLKRVSIVAVPALCGGLVWLYVVTRPPPPFAIRITYTSPPGAKVHPGDVPAWTILIDGGKSSIKPMVAVESLSPALLPTTGLQLEPMDLANRKYKLTARSFTGETGPVKIKVSVDVGATVETTTNLVYEIIALGPPMITLPSSVPLVLEGNRDSLTLPFTVSDEKTDAKELILSATVETGDKVICNVQTNGGSRTVTLSRKEGESGLVKLAVRLVAPDGRETNQTYDVTVAPPPPPSTPISELLKQARKDWLMKQYAEAIRKCDEVLARDPQCVEALTIKGGVLYSSARHTEALNYCNKALEIDPHCADAWFTKGAAEETLKKYQEAINSYQKFLQFSQPGDPRRRDVQNRIQSLTELLKPK